MIRINLLPEERRRKEKTPLLRFMVMNASIIICLLLIIWNAYLYNDVGRKTKALQDNKVNLAGLQQKVVPYDRMLVKEQQLKSWNTTALQIKNTREFLWWEKIDELWDFIYSSRDVWITTLQAIDGPGGLYRSGGQVTASIKMNCLVAGASSDRMTSFRVKLKSHPTLRETFNLGINEPPQFTIVAMPEYKEEFAVRFDIELARGVK